MPQNRKKHLTLDQARARLQKLLSKAQSFPSLKRMIPAPGAWSVELALVSAPKIQRLNAKFRDKNRPTDVLSFPAPEVFRRQGLLGELVICTAVLKAQAKEHAHSELSELEILIAHGILHLLGMDHERGPQEATRQRRWEQKLLAPTGSRAKSSSQGLLARSGLG